MSDFMNRHDCLLHLTTGRYENLHAYIYNLGNQTGKSEFYGFCICGEEFS